MAWPTDDGEMAERIKKHDWTSSSLGTTLSWPQSLKTAVELMVAAAQPVLITWGEEQTVIFNDHYLPILGDKQTWALGAPFADVWREIWEEYRPLMDAVMAGQSYFFRDRLVALAGRQHGWFTFSFTPLRDETGRVRGLFNVATETTERVMADKALIDSMDEGFAVFESIFDAEGKPCDFRWIATNPAFESQTGRGGTVGRTLKEVLPELEGVWFDIFSRVVKSGQSARFTQESASEGKWYDCYAFRYGAEDSSRMGLLFRDVTQTRTAQQALLDSSRRKDEFLAMLAHELRNPLAPIAAGADLLNIPGITVEHVKRTSEVITRQVRHMTGIVDDLLDVSRVTRGQVKLELVDLDLHQVVLESIEQVRPLLHARTQRLTVEAATLPASVRGDSKRLVQTFGNLLTNAAKYTPEGGHIAISIEALADAFTVSVSDNGQGMSPELLAECFELFVQAERTTERSAGGLGIGLALVRSIVSLHAGTVVAKSDGIGKGSAFTVTLPRTVPARLPDRDGPSTSNPLPENGWRLQVLVVDDNDDAGSMLAMLIAAMGHDTVVENHPRRALDRLAVWSPDVCFLDIGLPDMDGYELAREIRSRLPRRPPKLVAVTGYGQQQHRDRSLEAGFDEHLTKPASHAKLQELLDAARQDLLSGQHQSQ